MAPTKVSNPRDLVVQLMGELLYVERRLADDVIRKLATAARDEGLSSDLQEHRLQTLQHVERLETAFRRLEVAPTSNLSRAFESAVAEHDDLAPAIVEPRLADIFHARAALQSEHWELAAYSALLPLVSGDLRDLLRPSFDEEGDAARRLVATLDRLVA